MAWSRETEFQTSLRPRTPTRLTGRTLEECLTHFQIPFTAEDIRRDPMALLKELSQEISLAAQPFVHTARDMAWFNAVHEWEGYNLALNHLNLWVLDARKTCEDPGGLAMLATLKAYLEREIEVVPDLS